MSNVCSIEELRDLGAGVPAGAEVVRLYHEAFARFRIRCLWNWRELDTPTIAQALAVADSLRVERNLEARAAAVELEQSCRAAL